MYNKRDITHKNPSPKTPRREYRWARGILSFHTTGMGSAKMMRSVRMLPAALAYHDGSVGMQTAPMFCFQKPSIGRQLKTETRRRTRLQVEISAVTAIISLRDLTATRGKYCSSRASLMRPRLT